jgi:hypothetical protein
VPANESMMNIRTLTLLLSISVICSANAQFSIGTWRDHLPYQDCIDLCKTEKLIYCATPYSIFSYDPNEDEMVRISKATLLTDIGITAIEYDPTSKLVIVGYENGNIDLLAGEVGYNIPDIKFSSVIGDKAIYDILPFGNKAYLSTGFGVVVIDMLRREVKETYFIGENGGPVRVLDLAINDNTIYAATETGLQVADINNPFLANFINWNELPGLPGDSIVQHLEFFNNHMVVSIPDDSKDVLWKKDMNGGNWEIQSSLADFRINQLWTDGEWLTTSGSYAFLLNHFDFSYTENISLLAGRLLRTRNSIVTNTGVWAADKFSGLMWRKKIDGSEDAFLYPDGPSTAACRRIGAYNNNVWIAHGGVRPDWGNLWSNSGISGLVDDKWRQFSSDTMTHAGGGFNPLNNYIADFMDVAVDPIDNSRLIAASWEEGLVEIDINSLNGETRNGSGSSGLQLAGYTWAPGWIGAAGIAFDDDGVAWCTNTYTSEAIHALDRNGNFFDFNFAPTIFNTDKIGDIIISESKIVWAPVVGRGLLALNYNNTLGTFTDDSFKLLTETEGNGKLASNDVICIEEDLDGEVWVGTGEGLSIFYNPDAIFTDENFDSEQILIEQDGNVQILLATEIINCIEIDGSNRKWIGTQNSGAYLLSDDGLRQVYHFTSENSPLLSNTVYDIAINHSNGEVYFATENGVIGFFSTATNFDQEMTNVRVFPNPVRPEYDGNITIDGLAYNTNVKITDIQGNILFETESEGGRAVWNGLKYDGGKPATGVYLVYVTTPDGSADDVKQLTFIH